MSTATLNECRLIGNVGADPEVRHTASGKRVASVSLATSSFVGDRVFTEWHRVVFWGALADRAEKYVRKGSSILVGGRLQHRAWLDSDGVSRSRTEVVADQLQLLGSKRGDGEAETSGMSAHEAALHGLPVRGDEDDDVPF